MRERRARLWTRFPDLLGEPHSIEARIPSGAPALQPSVRHQPADEFRSAGPVNPRRCHDRGLAQAVSVGNRLQHRELAECEVRISHIACEQAVRALTRTMQEMQRRKEPSSCPVP